MITMHWSIFVALMGIATIIGISMEAKRAAAKRGDRQLQSGLRARKEKNLVNSMMAAGSLQKGRLTGSPLMDETGVQP